MKCTVWDDGREKATDEVSGFDVDTSASYPFYTIRGDWFEYAEPHNEPAHEFKPFDRVLVRDHNMHTWKVSLFGYKNPDGEHVCFERAYRQCIQYEGNEALLGTTNSPKLK